MIRYLKQWLAIRRLNRLVSQRRNSFDCESYRRHRAAMLKHTRGVA